MIRTVLRALRKLALVVAVLWVARALFERWVDGPEPRASDPPWPAPAAPPADLPAAPPQESPAAWVAPADDGAVPASHPVKAKISSRIYHLPGTASYSRTRPDRCYESAEAAEADGFHRAKR